MRLGPQGLCCVGDMRPLAQCRPTVRAPARLSPWRSMPVAPFGRSVARRQGGIPMKKISSFLSLTAVLAAAPAWADSTVGEPVDMDDATIIVTASRATTSAREIGSSVSVITREDISRGQITFVKDILQDMPGVLVSSDRPGSYTSVSIRGSNNDEVLWLIDGIKLGDPSSTSTQFQADHLISSDVARVEILRGNQSSLYGSDAIGGVINIITRRATEDGISISGEAEGGSHGTLNGGASVIGKNGPVDFRLTATGYRHDGPSLTDPRTATSPVTEDDEYWRYGLSGRVGVEASQNLSFSATGFWLNSFSDLDNTTSDSLNTVKKKEYAIAGQGLYESSDGKFKAKLTGSRYVARRLYFGTYNRPEGDLYKGIKDDLSLDLSYDTGGILSLAAGGGLEREKTDQITFYSGDFFAKVNTKSAYGEIALRPVEGMTVTGAARIDDNSRFGTFDTYRGTIAYVTGPLKLRASYGTGAKAPGLYQLFDPTYGNASLQAEKSRGGDIGFDLTLNQDLTVSASYFFLKKKNEIVFDDGRPPFGGYDQYGLTRASGVEFEIKAKPLDWLGLSQSFTYTDHEVFDLVAGDYENSGRPKYTATSSVTVSPLEGAEFTARARFRDGDSSSLYTPASKAYAVVDLLGSYRISENFEIYGRVVNLFDKWYQVSYGTNTLGRSVYGGIRFSF
jgi:vitamin B12 transporter